MIDGIRIHLQNKRLLDWKSNSLLQFAPSSEKANVWTARHNGLIFEIVQPKRTGAKHYYITGSLHRFANDGEPNTDDFCLERLKEAVSELPTFGVDVMTDKIENLEFGVNIALPFPCQRVFDALVAMPKKTFQELKFSDTSAAFGRVVEVSKNEYRLKIYDKGKQADPKRQDSHHLRIEIHANKMRPLKASKIQTVADLCDSQKLAKLAALLLDTIDNCILFDLDSKQVNNLLSIEDRDRVKDWRNPKFWQELNFRERFTERKRFVKFTQKGGFDVIKTLLGNLVSAKCAELLNLENIKVSLAHDTAKKDIVKSGNDTTMFSPPKNNPKTTEKQPKNNTETTPKQPFFANDTLDVSHFPKPSQKIPFANDTLDVFTDTLRGENILKRQQQQQQFFAEKSPKKPTEKRFNVVGKRVCVHCEKDILDKRPKTVFCGDKCRMAYHGKHRDRRKPKTEKTPPSVVEAVTTPPIIEVSKPIAVVMPQQPTPQPIRPQMPSVETYANGKRDLQSLGQLLSKMYNIG
jgi:hypothetical protein